MKSPSIALIGARRAHQGLGPFVAKFLANAGATIPAFVGTTEASNALASVELAQIAGLQCTGYTDLESLLDEHKVDAIAILSPAQTHGKFLDLALENQLHVLCEKPFLLNGVDAHTGVDQRLDDFQTAGLVVSENCQWPRLLPSYEELFGSETLRKAKRFAMGLSPSSSGVSMGSDSLSHPLSLLQAVDPGPAKVSEVQVHPQDAQSPLQVHFRFQGPSLDIQCRILLEDSPLRPRPAWIQFNSSRADRLIRETDYAIFLGDGSRQVQAPDPMEIHLREFVQNLGRVLNGDAPPSTSAIRNRARMLTDLLAAFPTSDS